MKNWRSLRASDPQRQINTILKAAKIVAPASEPITPSELIAYLNEYAEGGKEKSRERLMELDREAIKIIGKNAL
jgi:hypothetical protein